MPFALMRGQKDGLFLIAVAASHRPLILWLSAASPVSYANVVGCGIQNGNASSNHTPSATQSELQRNSAALSTEIRDSCPFSAILPQQTGPQRTGCSAENGVTVPLFSGGHTRSPVSQRALGECKAIRSRGFNHSELTFVGILKNDSGASYKPFSGPEARVFHDMEGEMWVDCKQERLAGFDGHLTQAVKFGFGLVGHLDKGGHFEVRQAEVVPGHWA
jgi:hypothetical protein